MNKLACVAITATLSSFTACGGGSIGTQPPPPQQRTVSASVGVKATTNGSFDLAISTSFQPAEWDYTFFQTSSSNKLSLLSNLQPQHIRLQGISEGVPQGSEGTTSTAWDFTTLDGITQPVLGIGDHSPQFQIAKAPPFMYINNDASNSFSDLTFQQFAGYAKNLVRYYNAGGFTPPGGSSRVSPAYPSETITWWGIYNEPSINNHLDANQYTTMYNALVPAMQSVDPNLKFVALEMCGASESWVQTFAAGVTAKVDVVASHYYSSCNQRDKDSQVFGTVPGFASSVQTIHGYLSANPALANVPVWVTENNVNADFQTSNGSACNPGQTFVTDRRGSDAFFAAWRPYVFSRLGQAGVQALYHWDFDADAQFGEVDFNTGHPQLSYWADYWLAQMFPAGSSQQLLQFTNSDNSEVEVLPVLNTDGSIVVMISNHAVASPSDNDGDGLTANISLDVSALGAFSSATQVKIDSSTNPSAGPTPAPVSTTTPIALTLNGYGVVFVVLQ
jgi:hypothetical protein